MLYNVVMASIELIKGSDGSANASMATVQSTRAPAATTIDVDTVAGINPAGFAGSMGTPHTFTDPVTSETITVISEATAVDFTGHVDGTNLEIDDIAPGYTDAGSAVGDIVIIRPTTQYSDNLAEVLETSLNDDGTLKDDIVEAANMIYGMVRGRRGGSATNWTTAGTTGYDYSAVNVHIQVGAFAPSAQTTNVTFKDAFTQPPVVVCTPGGSGGVMVSWYINVPTTTGFSFVTNSGGDLPVVYWIAIGQ